MTHKVPVDPQLERLTELLGQARRQSDRYLSGDALPVRKDIAAVVAPVQPRRSRRLQRA